jgi:hypothetical protein
VVTWIECSHLLWLVSHFIFVIDLNDALASLDEKHVIFLRPRIVLLKNLVFGDPEVDLHSRNDVIEKVTSFVAQYFLFDNFLVKEEGIIIYFILSAKEIIDRVTIFPALGRLLGTRLFKFHLLDLVNIVLIFEYLQDQRVVVDGDEKDVFIDVSF